jgi:hypothetical protein
MNDKMHGRPGAMEDFSRNLQNPNLIMSTSLPAGCGGAGMDECRNLRTALTLAMTQADGFLRATDEGFNSFKAIALTCGNEYETNDHAGALAIARTMLALPEQITDVDKNEQQLDSTLLEMVD